MKAKLIKEKDYYDLYRIDEDGKRVTFASTEDYKQKLSKQNCDKIFGVFDIESWIKETLNDADVKDELMLKTSKMCLKAGFNKAMELNKDKVFTLEDLERAYLIGCEHRTTHRYHIDENLMPLKQPTEIEVEIEMGDTPIWEDADVQGHVVCKKCSEWLESQIKPYTCKCINKPKLDSEGCLILKKI